MVKVAARCSPRVCDVLIHKVQQHLGMDFSGARVTDLLRRLRSAAGERQVEDPDGWLQDLAFADWDAALVQQLIPCFSVGETYFRRDSEAFDWLRVNHLAPLLQRRRAVGNLSLRLWSAGCCTGEEAYGLLFLIDEMLRAERRHWSVELVASDINDEFLAQAEQGIYGQHAFRAADEPFRHRYFQASGQRWRVRPAWRGRIRFKHHNLANGTAAPALPGADLILCRNVLMYLSGDRAVAAVRRLVGALDPDGILLLSAVEAGLANEAGFEGSWAGSNYAVSTRRRLTVPEAPTALATIRSATDVQALKPRAPSSPVVSLAKPRVVRAPAVPEANEPKDSWPRAAEARAAGRHEQARAILLDCLNAAGASKTSQHQACLELAHSWADQQCLAHAQEWVQKALALEPASLPAYWLQALLGQQSGDIPLALAAVQKALYLEPEFILGHFMHARLLRSAGQRRAGAKALRNCRQLLADQPGDAPLPLGDGLSCAQLSRLCEQFDEERA